jgi:hypothetical protein
LCSWLPLPRRIHKSSSTTTQAKAGLAQALTSLGGPRTSAAAVADYIENFYNPARRHSSISYLTPDECEALHFSETQARFS